MCRTFRNCRRALVAIAIAAALVGDGGAVNAQSGGPKEGIKVHGDWVIDVRNPDGTLVAHYEFQNALANHLGASTFLNGVLARTKQVGKWAVVLSDTAGQPVNWLVEPGVGGFGAASEVLSAAAPTTGVNAGKLVLSGSVAASRNAQIVFVQTEQGDCPPPGTPGACTVNAFAFSQKDLPSPITVVEGQIIQVTVVFSFS
jgi:hypothetical protein